ncbi:sigma-70 family RNA polymerase sigma factor [Candidatus Omnitrophota bacterium]
MNSDPKNITTSSSEDISLVQAFCNGEKEAFDRLVLKYKDKVFNLCYRFSGNREDADDCAQEAFIKVYRSLTRFRQESSFSTWLYTITSNTCKNKLASIRYKEGKIAIRLDKPVSTEEGSVTREIKGHFPDPKRELERKEKGAIIQEAIDTLPQDQKTVVVLRDIEGLSYEEIAEVTGHAIGTVKSKLSRARDVLRMRLKGLI